MTDSIIECRIQNMEFTKNTPWGQAQHVKPVGDQGIRFVSCTGHGGIFVPDALMAKMPEALKGSNSYSGSGQWFEEDVEWAIPVLAFPEQFPKVDCKAAVETIGFYADKKVDEYLYSVVKWLASPKGELVKSLAN